MTRDTSGYRRIQLPKAGPAEMTPPPEEPAKPRRYVTRSDGMARIPDVTSLSPSHPLNAGRGGEAAQSVADYHYEGPAGFAYRGKGRIAP